MKKVDEDPLLALVGILKNAFPEGAEEFLRDIRKDKSPYPAAVPADADPSI